MNRALPYVEKFNHEIYTPSLAYAKQSYDAYGAPRLQQAREYGEEKWASIVRPQIDTAQAQVKKQYDSNLAPQVNKAFAGAAPFYTSSRNSVSEIYDTHVLPALETSRPYAERVYAFGHRLTVETGLPYARAGWTSTVYFFDHSIWPKLRILYGDNVEPQLVRIGERLGRYRDGRKLKALMEEDDISSKLSSASSSATTAVASILSDQTSSSALTTESSTASASSSASPQEEARRTREKIESDLHNWQERFAKAADTGTEDLAERVKEITERQIDSQVHGVGEALVVQLEEASRSELAKLKKEIQGLVKNLPEEYDDADIHRASDSLSRSVRQAGVTIKHKAQSLRTWKAKYDKEVHSLVSAASESTLDVIDNIRDLGLQEIGLRWAQMEGVTYKDWSKYHEVKKTFDEWRQKIEAVARGHEGLQMSREAGEDIESRGMASAEKTAKELARLKEVGLWKIEARDISDDFSAKYMPAAAAAAGAQKVMDIGNSVRKHAVGTSQDAVESAVSEATKKVSDAVSSASSAVVGTEPGVVEQASSSVMNAASDASQKAKEAAVGTPKPKAESVISAAKDKANQVASDGSKTIIGTPAPVDSASSGANSVISSASSVASQASKKVYGGAMAQNVAEQKPILDDVFSDDEDATYSEKMQSMVNQAGDRFADVTKAVSEALMKATTTQGTIESASSVAAEQYSKALAAASSVLYGTETGAVESATSVAAGKYAQAVEA